MRLQLAIPSMGLGPLRESMTAAIQTAGYPLEILLWANGNTIYVDGWDLYGEAAQAHAQVYVGGSEKNLGAVGALQALYKMSCQISEETANEDDVILGYIHDDLIIKELDWDRKVEDFFKANPKMGLVGFHGATWLGQSHIYRDPYELVQLARGGVGSNMQDWKAHGLHWTEPRRVACVDGFSLFCRREFLDQINGWTWFPKELPHHVYDTSLACMAKRYGWEVWYLPVQVHHLGGRTATKVDYVKEFGRTESEIHSAGHEWMYEEFRDVLPIVEG